MFNIISDYCNDDVLHDDKNNYFKGFPKGDNRYVIQQGTGFEQHLNAQNGVTKIL